MNWLAIFLVVYCHGATDRLWYSHRLLWGTPERGLMVSVEFALNATLILNTSSDGVSSSYIESTPDTAYDLFYPWENKKARLLAYAINKEEPSLASLGWFALQSSTGITALGCSKQTILPTTKTKFLLGSGFAVNKDLCVENITVVLPNKTIVFRPACIKENSEHVRLPLDLGSLDRTTQNCYEFPLLDKNVICSQHANDDDYLLTRHDESYIELGFDSNHVKVALSLHDGNATLWAAWNDQRGYTNPELYLLGVLAVYLLAWTLLFSSKTTEPAFNDGTLVYFIYSGLIFSWIVLVYQLLARDLLFRAKFVVEPSIDNLIDIHGGFVLVALLLNTVLCVYYTHANNTAFQRSSFETLLALAAASVFLGRPTFCEESIAVFLIATTWSTFQLLYLKVATKPLFHLGLFVVIYPYLVFVMTEPMVRLVPDLHRNSFVWAQLLLFIPIFLFFGYRLLSQQETR